MAEQKAGLRGLWSQSIVFRQSFGGVQTGLVSFNFEGTREITAISLEKGVTMLAFYLAGGMSLAFV